MHARASHTRAPLKARANARTPSPARSARAGHGCAAGDLPLAGACTCSKVRGLARRLTGLYDAALARHGLTVTQYAALAVLARAAAPLAVAELARRLQMDRTTTSRLVRPLEGGGLIERADGPDVAADARMRSMRMTPRGRRKLRSAVPAWREAQRQVERLLGATLHEELHRVTDAAGRALRESKRGETA